MPLEIRFPGHTGGLWPKVRKVDEDGLTYSDRKAIDALVSSMGFRNVDELVERCDYSSVRELASDHAFTSVRDFFLGEGWYTRLKSFRVENMK